MGVSASKAKQGVPSSVRLRFFARRWREAMAGVVMVDSLLWRRKGGGGAPCGECAKAATEAGVVGEEADEGEVVARRTESRRRRRVIIGQKGRGVCAVCAVGV